MNSIKIPKYSEYTDSMICFLDLLGFGNLSKNISSSEVFQKVADIIFRIKATCDNYNQEKTLFKNLQLTAVSDSIIISMPYEDPICTYGIMTIIHQFQIELLFGMKQLSRGYLTFGKVFHKDNIIFGQGYCEAYESEQGIGDPKVVIDNKIIKDAEDKTKTSLNNSNFKTIFDLIRQDSDGKYFIDYLKPEGVMKNYSFDFIKDQRTILESFIDKSIKNFSNEINIVSKYEWLKNYFYLSQEYYNI